MQEYRLDDNSAYNVGESLPIDQILKEGMLVDVRGKTLVKASRERSNVSITVVDQWLTDLSFTVRWVPSAQERLQDAFFAVCTCPGQMGNKNHCVRHLKVVSVDLDKKVLLIRGAVPGCDGVLLTIKPSKTKWN